MAKKVWKLTEYYNGWFEDAEVHLVPGDVLEGPLGEAIFKHRPDWCEEVKPEDKKVEEKSTVESTEDEEELE